MAVTVFHKYVIILNYNPLEDMEENGSKLEMML